MTLSKQVAAKEALRILKALRENANHHTLTVEGSGLLDWPGGSSVRALTPHTAAIPPLIWAISSGAPSGVDGCWMQPLAPFDQKNTLEGEGYLFIREPNIVTTGDPWLLRPCGHKGRMARSILVHSIKGVACGRKVKGDPPKGPGGTFLEDGSGRVRALLGLTPRILGNAGWYEECLGLCSRGPKGQASIRAWVAKRTKPP